MDIRVILMIAVFVGFFVTTHFVANLYEEMRPPRQQKEKQALPARLETMAVQEDKRTTTQLVNRRNVILEETDWSYRRPEQEQLDRQTET